MPEEEKHPIIVRNKATKDEEEFYQSMVTELQRQTRKRPSIVNINIIAILGRLTGYCIGMCKPADHDMAKKVALENLDRGIRRIS